MSGSPGDGRELGRPQDHPTGVSNDISLMGLIRIVRRWRGLVVGLALGVAIITAIVMLFIPNWYTATGTILLEVSEVSSGLEMLGSIGAIAGLPTNAPSAEVYLAILRSERVAIAVAESLALGDHYNITADNADHRMEKTLSVLRKAVEIDDPDMASIRVRATDDDPEMAARIVNALLRELSYAKSKLSFSRARSTRRLVEEAIAQTESELEEARARMGAFQKQYGIFALDEQTSGTLTLITALQEQLIEAQTQQDALGSTYSENSAEYRRLGHVIEALETRIAGLVGHLDARGNESAPRAEELPSTANNPGFILPLSQVSSLSGQYARVLMDLKVLETKYSVLASRLEQAKIEESQSLPAFDVLDHARRPYRKSGPNRTFFTISALIGGFLIGVLLALFLEDLKKNWDSEVRHEVAALLLPQGIHRRLFRETDVGDDSGSGV